MPLKSWRAAPEVNAEVYSCTGICPANFNHNDSCVAESTSMERTIWSAIKNEKQKKHWMCQSRLSYLFDNIQAGVHLSVRFESTVIDFTPLASPLQEFSLDTFSKAACAKIGVWLMSL